MSRATCKFDDCDRPSHGRGLCETHYRQIATGGALKPILTRKPQRKRNMDDHELAAWILSQCVPSADGCLEWRGYTTANGYGRVFRRTGSVLTHRFVLATLYGPPPFEKAQAMHGCDNKICCNPDHLSWGTNRQNVADGYKRGLQSRRLSADQVIDIRNRLANGEPRAPLASEYGVSLALISAIKHRSRYSWVQ